MTRNVILNVGIIGCGKAGQSHLQILSARPDCDVVMVADLYSDRFGPIAQAYPSVIYSTNPDEIIENPAVDAIVIATPTDTHFDLARHALQFGKHLLCAAPLVLQPDEAMELNRLARSHALTLMVAEPLLYHNGIRKLREQICFGECGDIRFLRATQIGSPESAHSLYEMAARNIAIISHLLSGQPTTVAATIRGGNNHLDESVAFITLLYPGGVTAQLDLAHLPQIDSHDILIGGSRRAICWNQQPDEQTVRIFEDEGERVPSVGRSDPVDVQDRHFLVSICRGEQPMTHGNDATAVANVIEAIRRSAKQEGQPVTLPFTDGHRTLAVINRLESPAISQN